MPVAPGTRLGQYEILSPLGAGGMGEVYRARDTRLGREAAVKILHLDISGDDEKLRRFEQEARAASALNHPNILTVYEVGHADSVSFIATELIDGETLRLRMTREPLTLREALDISIQIVSALAAAHRAGVVHRDVKPENVMVREDGIVKVLDFGLAKLGEGVGGQSQRVDTEAETRGLVQTAPGVVMGTVQYMSPEQARGVRTDARTDVFSLGVVLYEMLTGRRPFGGETKSDVLAAVLMVEPKPITDYFPEAPAELSRIVSKTLRKDREERYQTSKELHVDLRSLRQDLDIEARMGNPTPLDLSRAASAGRGDGRTTRSRAAAAGTAPAASPETFPSTISELLIGEVKRHPRRVALTAGVVVLIVAALGFGLYKLIQSLRRPASFQTMRLTKLTHEGNVEEMEVVISPDGKQVAYVTKDEGQRSLWVRQVGAAGNVQIVPPSPNDYYGLTFSPDGDYVYYVVFDRPEFPVLYRVPSLGGGPPRKLVEDALGPVTFSPDGRRMAFIRGNHTLMIADADGGGVQALSARPGGEIWQRPAWSPDGSKIACGVFSKDGNVWRIVEVSVKDGSEKTISPQKWVAVLGIVWLPEGDGLLINGRGPESRQLQVWLLSYPGGEASRVTNDLSSYVGLSLTADGRTLASVQSERLVNLWVAPEASADLARRITFEAGKDEGLSGLSWTPDGRIVYAARAADGEDIWIVGEDGRDPRQLTANSRVNRSPSVTPDGRHVVFVSNRTGNNQIWRMDIDGGNPVQLTDGPGAANRPHCSPDGKWVVYQLSVERALTIWKVPVDGGDPVQLTDVNSTRPAFSPDGQFVVCDYGEAKPDSQIKLAVIPAEGGPPVRLLDNPAAVNSIGLRWTPDGHGIVYIDSRDRVYNLWSQPLDGGPPIQLTNFKTDQIFQFDWSRDGKRLAMGRGREGSDVVLISNFR